MAWIHKAETEILHLFIAGFPWFSHKKASIYNIFHRCSIATVDSRMVHLDSSSQSSSQGHYRATLLREDEDRMDREPPVPAGTRRYPPGLPRFLLTQTQCFLRKGYFIGYTSVVYHDTNDLYHDTIFRLPSVVYHDTM